MFFLAIGSACGCEGKFNIQGSLTPPSSFKKTTKKISNFIERNRGVFQVIGVATGVMGALRGSICLLSLLAAVPITPALAISTKILLGTSFTIFAVEKINHWAFHS